MSERNRRKQLRDSSVNRATLCGLVAQRESRIAELEDIHKRLLDVKVIEEDTYYGSTTVRELIGLEDDLLNP